MAEKDKGKNGGKASGGRFSGKPRSKKTSKGKTSAKQRANAAMYFAANGISNAPIPD